MICMTLQVTRYVILLENIYTYFRQMTICSMIAEYMYIGKC